MKPCAFKLFDKKKIDVLLVAGAARKALVILVGGALICGAAGAQIVISDSGVAPANPGALLEMDSNSRGLLFTRIPLTDSNTWGLAGSQPVDGMVVYNTTSGNGLAPGLMVWTSGRWVNVNDTSYLNVNAGTAGNASAATSGATGTGSMAVGPDASAAGGQALAVGQNTSAAGAGAVAVGHNASASGAGSVALGESATADTPNSVALGAGSQTRPTVATPGTRIAGNDYAFAGGSPAGAVSVGSSGSERQVQNVAAGQLSPTSTDAVNGSQLYATNRAVEALNASTGALQSRVDRLQDQLSRQGSALSGGIAAAAAMAVVTPMDQGRYHLTGSLASYNGQAGVGMNLLRRSDDGRTTLHAGVGWGTGGSKAIARVGFGVSFD